jgi:high-affinity nickel permease
LIYKGICLSKCGSCFIVATVEIAPLIGEHLHVAPWSDLASIDLTGIGFVSIGSFAIISLGAILTRWGRLEATTRSPGCASGRRFGLF